MNRPLPRSTTQWVKSSGAQKGPALYHRGTWLARYSRIRSHRPNNSHSTSARSQMTLPSLTATVASVAERYLTLLRVHPHRTYDYAKRGFFGLPVIEVEMHGPKCRIGESWVYFAVSNQANPTALGAGDRLYVGAQTQDRMFRGDGMGGDNFHHAEMRAGRGDDNPVTMLKSGGKIAIFRARADRVADVIKNRPELQRLQVLAQQPRTPAKHLGWWFEQYILYSEPGQWRWNTALASREISRLFAS